MTEKFQKIKDIVEQELSQEKDSTHDIDHIMRVYNLAMTIAKTEPKVNLDILQAAVLLHDIGGAKESNDPSGQTDHAVVGALMAKPILESWVFPLKILNMFKLVFYLIVIGLIINQKPLKPRFFMMLIN